MFPELGLGCNEVDRSLNAQFGGAHGPKLHATGILTFITEDIPSAGEEINPCLSNASYCADRFTIAINVVFHVLVDVSFRPILCNVSCIARQYGLYMTVRKTPFFPAHVK